VAAIGWSLLLPYIRPPLLLILVRIGFASNGFVILLQKGRNKSNRMVVSASEEGQIKINKPAYQMMIISPFGQLGLRVPSSGVRDLFTITADVFP
jgi:hypothetical protein